MKKIIILGISRAASKLYKEILKKNKDVYILHEIMFDFRFKIDLYSIFKKYNIDKNRENIKLAIEEIYSKSFLRYFKIEYPDKDLLIENLSTLDRITWSSALNCIIELKAKILNKKIAGAKGPVHCSYAPKLLKELKNTKVIYILRDPRAIYASEIPMKSKDNEVSQFPRLKNKFLQRFLIFVHTNIEWIWTMIIYMRIKDKVLLCKYEELIKDPEKMIKRIFEFCELAFLKEYTNEVSIIGSSHQINNTSGFSKHGIDKWRNDLSVFEKGWFKLLIIIFNYKSMK